MKKSTKWQTVISLILILAVLAFGVIAYLTAQRDITSTVKINIPDNAVRIQLYGDATWVKDTSVAGKIYDPGEISGGADTKVWKLPDVSWNYDEENKKYDTSTMTIRIENENQEVGLKVSITGLQEVDDYGRFSTKSYFKVEGDEQEKELDSDYNFTINKETKVATFFVKYTLLQENSSFNIKQDINIKIDPEVQSD